MAQQPPIRFIITGGTIDSHYDGTKDTAVPNRHSVIPEYIQGLKLHQRTKFTEVCMKDSRDVTLRDMAKVKKVIEKSGRRAFIITHGTYTMPDTARYLKKHFAHKKMVIILTGAFIPLLGFTGSDGPFNIGFSLAMMAHLDPGVYICMNGKIFDPDEVAKMIKEGKFVSMFEKGNK